MSSDFNYNFCFVVEQSGGWGILQNLDVSESALKHKHMEKNLGSIEGRQATVDVLIRRLRTHSDWLWKLSQRTLIGRKNYQKIRFTRTYLSNTLTNLCIALYCILLYCVVLKCIVLLIYCCVDIIQYNANWICWSIGQPSTRTEIKKSYGRTMALVATPLKRQVATMT